MAAAAENMSNIGRLLEPSSGDPAFLDLGCDDGALTVRVAEIIGTTNVHGLEIVEERAAVASSRGVHVKVSDLNHRFPYDDEVFDVVYSNQVVEHMYDTDNFVRDVFRVLRPGGYAVISTENLSSWHNIVALLLGWQPFSLTNVSHRAPGMGNPLALHRGGQGSLKSWEHLRVFSYRGLRELFTSHGFRVEKMFGAGYFPFPPSLGRWDARHAAFLTVKARRPQPPLLE